MKPSSGHAGWNHNLHYHSLVLKVVPAPCARALDVGCGEGALTWQLGRRCGKAIGLDLDRHTLNTDAANVRFLTGDVMSYPFQPASFDFIAAIATLHHLPLEAALISLRDLLAPGGVLVIVGLYRAKTMSDYAMNALALPLSHAMRLLRGYASMDAAMKKPEQSYAEIAEAAQRLLPGCKLQRKLFFRYSLVWHKPAGVGARFRPR